MHKITIVLRTVENGIQMHHGSLRGTMTFLLAHGPLCGLSRKSHTICRWPSPWPIDETSDYLDRTCIKSILSGGFGFFERVLVDLTIPILSPTPILQLIEIKSVNVLKAQWAYHLNGIEFTVKFRQEYTLMAGLSDYHFKHGNLVRKILLLAEKASHAAIIVLERTNWRTFCSKLFNIKASFFQCLLKALLFPVFSCHLLDASAVLGEWIWVRDYGVLLAALCSAIRFVHLKCFKCIRW